MGVVFSFVFLLLLLFLLLTSSIKGNDEVNKMVDQQRELIESSNKIIYYDEVLTMSARTSVARQDLSWEYRYLEFALLLDNLLEKTLSSFEQKKKIEFLVETRHANNKLVEMEERSFALSKENKWKKAENVLYSEEYLNYKAEYSKGLEKLQDVINAEILQRQKNAIELQELNIYLDILLIIVVIILGLMVSMMLYRWSSAEQQSYGELQIINTELEEFTYRISHDLRSPIVSSIKLLSITKQSIENQELAKAIKSTSLAQGSLEKLNILIQDILSVTETRNKTEIDIEIDFERLLNDSLTKLSNLNGFEKIDIQENLNFEGTLHTKYSRLQMILENFISNAIKYHDQQKPHSYINIATRLENQTFVLEVMDNGIGVPENQQQNLFKMFHRFHPKISFGSGLGLYLVQKSASVLGGEVSHENTNDGTLFRLTITL